MSWAGLEPLSPGRGDPDWDVAWTSPAGFFVVEVKSISNANEERQLRLAVGQVLRYRQRMMEKHDMVTPVIAVSQEPVDRTWDDLCRPLGIVLVWPANFKDRLQLDAR